MPAGTDPLVSILIPCFNGAAMLHRCLHSLARQTDVALEVVFVDNNSRDGSADIARAWARTVPFTVRVLHCAEQGQAAARNFALTQASGTCIQWLDCDDELLPGKLARQVAALEADPAADIAYGSWHWCFLRDGAVVAAFTFAERPRAHLLRDLLANDWRAMHSYLLRCRAALDLQALGLWDVGVGYAADRHYFTTAALAGHRFVFVEGAEVIYNSWSMGQLTHSRSAALGAAALTQVYARLRAQQRRAQTPLSAEQRWLLDQPRGLLQASPAAAPPQCPAAQAIHRLLQRQPAPASIETWASRFVRAAWQDVQRQFGSLAPVQHLSQLRAALDSPLTRRVEDARDLALLLQPGLPLVAPVLIEELLHVRRSLDTFIESGQLRALESVA